MSTWYTKVVQGNRLPVLDQVDIIVAGGTIGGIAAALKATKLVKR